ncbi:hypothetical protein PF005_g18493 [Phytophthora fragariae]|nr:hypothetical protein PF011_g20928 [Phytophthora fragariae]KAE9078575.1 hypothetical protein PF007_g23797 [Phytophthora fragariae]KAE9192354.1 hypothetical protein PF005_g18493 [Phytophthora fragariae]
MMHEVSLTASAAADEDWRSGAAAILDSYEDAMWDEMRQQEAAVSGASPVKSPAELVLALDTSDGKSPIGGEEQTPSLGGGGVNGGLGLASTLDALWAAGVASQPASKVWFPSKCWTARNCLTRGQCNCGGKKIATVCVVRGNGNEKSSRK